MAEAIQLKTLKDMLDFCIEQSKASSTDAKTIRRFKRILNMNYHRASKKRKFDWRTDNWDLNVGAYHSDGTISLTNGDREFTSAGASLTEEMIGRTLVCAGDTEMYEIVGIDEVAQTGILSSNYVGTTVAGQSYKIFQYKFGLPPNFDEPVKFWHDRYRQGMFSRDYNEIMEYITRYPQMQNRAYFWTIFGSKEYDGPGLDDFVLDWDFLDGTDLRTKQLMIFPHVPDADYVIHMKYSFIVEPMIDDDDEPLIPIDDRNVIPYLSLKDFSASETDTDLIQYYATEGRAILRRMMGNFDLANKKPQLIGYRINSNRRASQFGLPVELGQLFDILD